MKLKDGLSALRERFEKPVPALFYLKTVGGKLKLEVMGTAGEGIIWTHKYIFLEGDKVVMETRMARSEGEKGDLIGRQTEPLRSSNLDDVLVETGFKESLTLRQLLAQENLIPNLIGTTKDQTGRVLEAA